jgi:hypothetical protein
MDGATGQLSKVLDLCPRVALEYCHPVVLLYFGNTRGTP